MLWNAYMSWLWNKIIEAEWNIAIADLGDGCRPVNLRWMRHTCRDRWFADPFLLQETPDSYIILAEEYLKAAKKGRICRLAVSKSDFCLQRVDTLLEAATHLSFPNYIVHEGEVYLYPESCASGRLTFYRLKDDGAEPAFEVPLPVVDPVILKAPKGFCLLGTLPQDANGGTLHIFCAPGLDGPYEEVQQVSLGDNTARRAGNVFEWEGRTIAPAQICNKHYGEGISLQEITFDAEGGLSVREVARMSARQITRRTGFHTFNAAGSKVIIDGYSYGSELIHDLYFKLRGLHNM